MKAKTFLILSLLLFPILSVILLPKNAQASLAYSSSIEFGTNELDTRNLVIGNGSIEHIANRGFEEAGDLEHWTHFWAWQFGYGHSGIESAEIGNTLGNTGWIEQTLSTPIAVSDIATFTMWFYPEESGITRSARVIVTYSSAENTTIDFDYLDLPFEVWTQVSVKESLAVGHTVTKVKIVNNCVSSYLGVDDVSLTEDDESNYMYAAIAGINPAQIIKIQLSTFTEVDALILSSGYTANGIVSNGTHLFIVTGSGTPNSMALTMIDIASFTEIDIIDSGDMGAGYRYSGDLVRVGDYVYATGVVASGNGGVAKFQIAPTFTFISDVDFGSEFNQAFGIVYYDTYLYATARNSTSVTGMVVVIDEPLWGIASYIDTEVQTAYEMDVVGSNLYSTATNGTGVWLVKIDTDFWTVEDYLLLSDGSLGSSYGEVAHYGSNQLFVAFNEAPAVIMEVNLGSWAVTQTLVLPSNDDDAEALLVDGSILYVGLREGFVTVEGRVAKIFINPSSLVSFDSSPAGVGSVGFTIDGGVSRTTPYSENLTGTHTFLRSEATHMANSSTVYGFNRWKIVNGSGTFYYNESSATMSLGGATQVTLEYTSLNIYVSSSPDCHPTFTSELGYTHTAAVNLTYPVGSHTFTAAKTVSANATYRYTFLYWKLNGTTNYPQVSISLNYAHYTTLQLFYQGATVPPDIPMIRNYGAYNATWYMRSDTHTVHEQLGYRLLTENTHTPSFDTRTTSGTANTSYGVRVWAIDFRGGKHELSAGSPVATVERTNVGASMLQGNWLCPAYGSMIDAIEVDLYQRFNSEPWAIIRIFVSSDDLLIRLPSSTWTFFYYVNKTTGSTNSTFGWGSYTIYSSRVNLQYYKASPWDMALARLMDRNFMGFMFTPWTYWFGDLFWIILLFGLITTAYMRFGSFKPILALLWILGGSGSILWAIVPATALHVAAIMLALAMAISLFRLIYK